MKGLAFVAVLAVGAAVLLGAGWAEKPTVAVLSDADGARLQGGAKCDDKYKEGSKDCPNGTVAACGAGDADCEDVTVENLVVKADDGEFEKTTNNPVQFCKVCGGEKTCTWFENPTQSDNCEES